MTTLTVGNATLQYAFDGAMPGMTVYNVNLISGNWPKDSNLGEAIDERYRHFGGKVFIQDEKRAMVGVYID